MNRRTFCEQLRRRSAACGSGTILQLSCYSSAHNPHNPALYHHHHKQLLVIIIAWAGSVPAHLQLQSEWRRKSNVVLKPSSRSRVSRRKMFVIDNRHTIKIQHVFYLNQRWASPRERQRVVCSKCIEPMWSYLAPAHPRPLQTDNGRNVLPPVQSCTSNILKLCPSALPDHHQKMVGFKPNPTTAVLG